MRNIAKFLVCAIIAFVVQFGSAVALALLNNSHHTKLALVVSGAILLVFLCIYLHDYRFWANGLEMSLLKLNVFHFISWVLIGCLVSYMSVSGVWIFDSICRSSTKICDISILFIGYIVIWLIAVIISAFIGKKNDTY